MHLSQHREPLELRRRQPLRALGGQVELKVERLRRRAVDQRERVELLPDPLALLVEGVDVERLVREEDQVVLVVKRPARRRRRRLEAKDAKRLTRLHRVELQVMLHRLVLLQQPQARIASTGARCASLQPTDYNNICLEVISLPALNAPIKQSMLQVAH
eukprot:2726023-Pleurochrysis_carterae.AAC.4